jgi:transposase
MSNAIGRPSKLTPELTKKLCDAIKAGNYYDTACQYVGIDYSTFRRWMNRGDKAKTGEFYDFCNAIKKAEAEAEYRMVALWQQQVADDWKASRDFLERRYPDKWGRKQEVKADIKQRNINAELDLSGFTTEELRKIAGFDNTD